MGAVTMRETLVNLVGIVLRVVTWIVLGLLYCAYTAVVGVVRIVFLLLRVVTFTLSDMYVLDPLYQYCFGDYEDHQEAFADQSLRDRIEGVFKLPFFT